MSIRSLSIALAAVALALVVVASPTARAGAQPTPWVEPVSAPVVDGYRPPAHVGAPGNRGWEYATEPRSVVVAAGPGIVVFAGPIGDVALHLGSAPRRPSHDVLPCGDHRGGGRRHGRRRDAARYHRRPPALRRAGGTGLPGPCGALRRRRTRWVRGSSSGRRRSSARPVGSAACGDPAPFFCTSPQGDHPTGDLVRAMAGGAAAAGRSPVGRLERSGVVRRCDGYTRRRSSAHR